jgi:hypothetical protein
VQAIVETTITVIFRNGSNRWDKLSPAEQEVSCRQPDTSLRAYTVVVIARVKLLQLLPC